jgi:hypothetical protein
MTPATIEFFLKHGEKFCDFAANLPTRPPNQKLRTDYACVVLIIAAAACRIELKDVQGWPDYFNGLESDRPFLTVADLLECVKAVAKHAGENMEAVLSRLVTVAKEKLEREKKEYEGRTAEFQRYRRSLFLPRDEELDKVIRYEAALERSFYKAMHELERLQAARNGQAVSPPLAVDVSLSGRAST